MKPNTDLYITIKGHVVCIHRDSGCEIWRTKLKRSGVSPVVDAGDFVIAYSGGHLFALDKSDGKILWENKLKGLGHGYCLIAGDSAQQAAATTIAQAIAAQQAAAAAS